MSTPHPAGEREVAAPSAAPAQCILMENRRAFLDFLERRLGQRESAEDLLQEAFTRALPKLVNVRDGEAVVAWFYRTLRNALIDHHRRTQTSERGLERLSVELENAAGPEDMERDATCRCVLRIAGSLRPNYADALRRIEVDGVSVKDFAVEQGISDNNAAARISRARKALRMQLEVTCGACAEQGCSDCTCSHPSTGDEWMEPPGG
ncbi:MAG TPA: sigma-70 family RNA polymerase sigma factor [Myxococcaceae bacterium]|nr:sigma-70 family RNA polymerase sigma factor [Myxococcaceae bacterium]